MHMWLVRLAAKNTPIVRPSSSVLPVLTLSTRFEHRLNSRGDMGSGGREFHRQPPRFVFGEPVFLEASEINLLVSTADQSNMLIVRFGY